MRFKIRPSTATDLPAAIALLRAADLPTEDLTASHLALVAEGEAGVLGVIGLERCRDVGLLRSLVVSPLARGRGLGRSLEVALESTARERGVRELWLLTIDADAFFSSLNFRIRQRDTAPEAIRGSAEFLTLCPGDAVLMSKEI
ncbi:MAG: GNAT family N-acetyltransferase [Gammaproteobacteria bacterium]|nr:GNAT family N-acetyltransferase [Gammaproteobacteria bacterium]MBU2676330.1 GNAT family N-acetyltransferase [Gammaproteobacteria bacterium]NNC56123.1 GNAT family N-acetyltransferase [Woeseiaceae bacterium]NNL50064.1 GNAT family N-acetyltransferase [Woeseiaceae bacterium]